MKVSTNINMFFIKELPIPRLLEGDEYFDDIVQRAAKLTCTTSDFDQLSIDILGKPASQVGVTDPKARQKLRNELDAIIAKLYGLNAEDLQYVLSKFPLVDDEIKAGVLEEFKKL